MNIGFQLFRAQNLMLSMINPDKAIARAGNIFFRPRRHTAKEWEQQAETRGRRMTLKNGASVLHWPSTNTAVTAVPLLFIHGWEGRATQMAGFAEQLTPLGFEVYAIDAPAHGQASGDLAHPMKFVESIFLAEQAFGPFYAVVGHSMGAGCALYAAMEGLQCEKIIAIAGPASFRKVSRRFAGFIGLNRKTTDNFIHYVENVVGLPFDQIDLVSRAAEIRQPVLIIHDRDDREIPFRDAVSLAKAIPNGQLYHTVGLGHRQIMRASMVVDTVRNFIALGDDQFLIEAI